LHKYEGVLISADKSGNVLVLDSNLQTKLQGQQAPLTPQELQKETSNREIKSIAVALVNSMPIIITGDSHGWITLITNG